MEDNVEFVNIFIQKQKNFIDDLVAKNLVLESKISLLEAKISSLETQLATMVPELPKTKKTESTY